MFISRNPLIPVSGKNTFAPASGQYEPGTQKVRLAEGMPCECAQ